MKVFDLAVKLASIAMSLVILAVPAQAITWGEYDGNDHPNVVTLLFVQNGEGFFSCTGTLLTPYVVLTAGHCTEGAGSVNDVTFVRNDPDIDAAIVSELLGIYGGDVGAWLTNTWVQGQAVPHPQFDDYAEFPDTYDVGLVLLQEPIYVNEYGALPTLRQFDFLLTARGPISKRKAAIVGYGLQGRIPPFAGGEYKRYKGESSIANLGHGAVLGGQNFQFTNNPGLGSGSGGTCSGDSGGPAFWIDPVTGQETNIVMAVNSYGIAPLCNGTDYQFRTDIETALEFIGLYLGWTPTP
jgi:hypothetical protein